MPDLLLIIYNLKSETMIKTNTIFAIISYYSTIDIVFLK